MISQSGIRGHAGIISGRRPLRLVFCLLTALLVVAVAGAQARAGAKSAMVLEAYSGKIILAQNIDATHPPASLAKMMTLYLAFEAIKKGTLRWNQRVTVSRHAASRMPSKIYLKAGQKVRIRTLVYATAVKSANDAASALAEAIAGSEFNFTRLMTRRARDLGMTKTRFGTASGLPARGQQTTARDMAKLARALILHYPKHYHILSTRYFRYGKRVYASTNRLLRAGKVDGMKTGYTRRARFNLVTSKRRGKRRLITVVLGASSSRYRYNKTRRLLAYGWKNRGNPNLVASIRKPVTKPQIALAPRERPERETATVTVAEAKDTGNAAANDRATEPAETDEPADKSSTVAAAAEPAEDKTSGAIKVAEAEPGKRKVDLSILGSRAEATVRSETLDAPKSGQQTKPRVAQSPAKTSPKATPPDAKTRERQVAVADTPPPAGRPEAAEPETRAGDKAPRNAPNTKTVQIAARPSLALNRTIAMRVQGARHPGRGWTYALQVGAHTGLASARREARRAFDALPRRLRQNSRVAVMMPQDYQGKFYRARVVGLTKAVADKACDYLKGKSMRCIAVRTTAPTGLVAAARRAAEPAPARSGERRKSRRNGADANADSKAERETAADSTGNRESKTDDGTVIQVGAVSGRARARSLAREARGKLPESLSRRARPKILTPDTYGGSLYRVRLAGLSPDEADKACRVLKKESVRCIRLGVGVAKAVARRPAATPGGYSVQVGASTREGGARELADKAKQILPRQLARRVRPRILDPQTYPGRLYRARLTGLSREQADKACKILKSKALDCLPYRADT